MLSLLALGALFVAVQGLAWDVPNYKPGCSGFNMALIVATDPQKEVKFDVVAPINTGIISIPDYCPNIGGKLQFQRVEVCNAYKGLTSGPWKAPKSYWLGDNTPSPIYASCEGASDCGPLVVHVVQRCNPIPILTSF